jgi:hypothetical protein
MFCAAKKQRRDAATGTGQGRLVNESFDACAGELFPWQWQAP